MIKHYLKVALRNLMNFKVHSLISAICLAIGITCFSMMNYFIDAITGKVELSDNNKYSIRLSGASSQTAADIYLFKEDFDYLKELPIAGIDTLVASSSYSNGKEITAIDKKQRELPFLVSFQNVSSNYFTYNSLQLKYGNQEITAPDEVIVSRSFARKAFGEENPIGQVIRQETEAANPSDLMVYKIVNVALTEEKDSHGKTIDCYFPLSAKSRTPLCIRSRLTGQTTTESLNKQLKGLTWKHGDQDIYLYASLESEQNSSVQRTISILLARFIASLILLSGLINFLKFIIQMFYNRQRELVLRKCIGSDIKGLFALLFAEIFWMLSVAFLLSLAVTEITLSLIYTYIRPEDMISFSLVDLYGSQLGLYLALLLICMLAILYPIYRLRRLSVLHSVVQRQKRHVFRNFMIALQLADHAMDLWLTEETSRYMFRLLAVKEVFGNPQRFGFLLKREHLYPAIPYKEVAVDTEISDLSNFAQKQGITYAQLRDANPWLRGSSLKNKTGKKYVLHIPTQEGMNYDPRKTVPHEHKWVID